VQSDAAVTAVHPVLEPLVRVRPVVLVALPDAAACERIVASGALASLGRDRALSYVLPENLTPSMRAAAPALDPQHCTVCASAAVPEMAALFDRLKPVYAIVPTPLDGWCRRIMSACDEENVACLVLQTGWGDLSCRMAFASPAPFLGCWGAQAKDEAVETLGLIPKRVGALGAPQHHWLSPAPAAAARGLRTRLGVGDAGRLLLFCGSRGEFDELGALKHIDRAIARGSLEPMRVIYRPHPRATAAPDFAERAWQHVTLDAEAISPELSGAWGLDACAVAATLLAAADAVVAPVSSSVVIEALMLEKPTLAIAFGGVNGVNDAPGGAGSSRRVDLIRESSAVLTCEDPARLLRDCGRLFKPRWDVKTTRARTRLLDDVITREPGSYADRLADFCHERIDTIGRKMRAQRTGRRATISHTYGADLIAHEYTGVRGDAVVPGYWMHGWLPAYHNVHPALIALHKKEGQAAGYDFAAQVAAEKADVPQWVARADQAAYLAAHGYRHVRAIGLPIVYLPQPAVTRVPRSLLVLPPHSHRTHGPDDPLAEAYADAILGVRRRFEHVWVGISEDDILDRQWLEAFRRRGIGVFTTTDRGDARTLARLRRILSAFEYVTTNGFGSHIAMAAYCGAKVSVFGPFADFPRERMAATHAMKIHPELLDTACELCTEAAVRRHYPFLFAEPDAALARQEWGAAEVGEPCRLAPAGLRALFGWDAA
jgi:hypothetical protein